VQCAAAASRFRRLVIIISYLLLLHGCVIHVLSPQCATPRSDLVFGVRLRLQAGAPHTGAAALGPGQRCGRGPCQSLPPPRAQRLARRVDRRASPDAATGAGAPAAHRDGFARVHAALARLCACGSNSPRRPPVPTCLGVEATACRRQHPPPGLRSARAGPRRGHEVRRYLGIWLKVGGVRLGFLQNTCFT
jgi:hypothetical protein